MSEVLVGTAVRALAGQAVCGDAVCVAREAELVVIGIADGLGHGEPAAETAKAFCGYVASHLDQGVEEAMRGAHAELKGTRGVVAAVVRIDAEAGKLEFAGVGNIAIRARTGKPLKAFCTPGCLGTRLSQVRVFRLNLADGDVFILHSDGIAGVGDADAAPDCDVNELASALLRDHATQGDDASCVVIRYVR